jgi:hypothetical protein
MQVGHAQRFRGRRVKGVRNQRQADSGGLLPSGPSAGSAH